MVLDKFTRCVFERCRERIVPPIEEAVERHHTKHLDDLVFVIMPFKLVKIRVAHGIRHTGCSLCECERGAFRRGKELASFVIP